MERLSIAQIVQKIENGMPFHAVSEDYSFTIKIEKYVPFVCAAVHDGGQFRRELWDNCLHTAYERWYEEDPATKEMLGKQPIVLAGLDSRFEYDLNRSSENAIYTDAWGKQLWKKPLSLKDIANSLSKHHNFYIVVDSLIKKIEKEFSVCIVYDMHSYNWQRWDRKVPTWNIGTKNINVERFEIAIEAWRESLEQIRFPNGIAADAKINDTFYGNGYFLKHITNKFENTLVLATEIAKIYCDEIRQIMYPEVVTTVASYLSQEIQKHAMQFYAEYKR